MNLPAMSVSLTTSLLSPAALGRAVTWSAFVGDADPGPLVYSFRVRPVGGTFRRLVDYGPNASLVWTTIEGEGAYEMEVSVRNNSTNAIVATSLTFGFYPRYTAGRPVVSPTENPLVLIYSTGGCDAGSRMRVEFQAPELPAQNTPWVACRPERTMNFYLAGMRADSRYVAHHTIDSGSAATRGPNVAFATGSAPLSTPVVSLLHTATTQSSEGILLQSLFGTSAIATDLAGNLVWYSPGDFSYLTRAENGGTFLVIGEDGTRDQSHQFFREFDLAGTTIAETNAARVNEQIGALGLHSITGFHHEARKLSNGGYLVLAASERILTDVQGPGAVDVIGDTILVLNADLQVVWGWDAFDHLNTSRTALMGETCVPASGAACPAFYLAPKANDWLHGNSLQLTPDGNILYSSRHQDWLIKIDYSNGAGSGAVLWRLGSGGDFQIASSDPNPWFSHQHDANFESDGQTLTVFDDGNARHALDPNAHSRGQALVIHEQNRTASVLLNANLDSYSAAVGSAQKLSNGDYHFDSGFIPDLIVPGAFNAQSIEVDASGKLVYGIQFGALEYRTFRMRDLYTAP